MQNCMALFLVALALVLPACDKHRLDKQQIEAAWNDYRSAGDKRDGEFVASVMSQESINRYGRLLKLALDAPAKECKKFTPTDLLEIANMRMHYTRKDLSKLDGRSWVVQSVNDGQWDTLEADWKLTAIKIGPKGDTAAGVIRNPKAEAEHRSAVLADNMLGRTRKSPLLRGSTQVLANDEPPRTYPASFDKAGENWKFQESAILADIDKELIDVAKQYKIPVIELVTAIVTKNQDSDLEAAMKIWEPMPK